MKYIFYIITFFFCFSSNAQEQFRISMKISKLHTGKVLFLYYKNDTGNVVDSARFNNGMFVIKGHVKAPQKAFLSLAMPNVGMQVYRPSYARVPIYLEAGNILVSAQDDLSKTVRVQGTPLNNVAQGYADISEKYRGEMDVLRTKYGIARSKGDNKTLKEVSAAQNNIRVQIHEEEKKYFLANPKSLVSLDWIKLNYNPARQKSEALNFFSRLDKDIQNSVTGMKYKALLDATTQVSIGNTAPDFVLNDSENKLVSFSSFRGKYVLLDFWASWCIPCRKENPNVLRAYNQFKDKNFTVIGISIDNSVLKWRKAVEQDHLPWTQLIDSNADENVAGKRYGVTAIPNNFLIDPNGKIVAMNLRGESLEKALNQFIK